MSKHQNYWMIRALLIGLLVTAAISGSACSKAKAVSAAPEPTAVEVVKVEQKDVPIYSDWIGTLDGMVNAQIRAQVSGTILSKNYTEGSYVKKGDLLFKIDPRLFEAMVEQAKADLARAQGQLAQAKSQSSQADAQVAEVEANLVKVQLDLKRNEPLAKAGDISQRDVDNTVQSFRAGEAQLRAAKAAAETAKAGVIAAEAAVYNAQGEMEGAKLNLSFTNITAPIDGIAGIAQAQVGDLVTANNSNGPPLTTISTVDPIKAYFTLTEQEYLKTSSTSKGLAARENLELEMVLADGSAYPQKGKFYVADSKVDEKTGAIRVAGIFPNHGNFLRPGQYARVRAVTSKKDGALLIPQRAINELQGRFQVAVVNPDNKVEIRTVSVGERIGNMTIINQGLSVGEMVVAEGIQKVKSGSIVNAKPFTPPPPSVKP